MSGQSKYEKDFDEFWNEVNNHYAYYDQQKIDWNRVKEIYQTQVRKIETDNDFIRFMEKVMHEFHNGHISLNKI
jgi:carboxyl-terminal processing protease